MNQERKTCQNCKQQFVIEPADFKFYEKMQVPPPTFCPDCRLQRRMAWRNERTLYARSCNATKEDVISCYHQDAPFPVYKREYWYSDKWDPLSYGREYNFSKPFFEQFGELFNAVPRLQAWLVDSVGCDYTNYTVTSKDCYNCFTALGGNENCMHSSYLNFSVDSMDCHLIKKCELCFECVNCEGSYNLKYSVDSINCRDSLFLSDCNNCTNCFLCVGLHNKQYHIFNKPYSKEEYQRKVKAFAPSFWRGIQELKKQFREFEVKFPKKFMHGRKNVDVSGDYIYNSKNCHNSYLVNSNEDSRYVVYAPNSVKSYYDVFISVLSNEFVYESHAIPKNNYFIRFCDQCGESSSFLEYSSMCLSSQNLFGCVGVRGKKYCILNKQYSQSEYESLRKKVIEHMNTMPYIDKRGRVYTYGEFFPIELSPFGYNESVAQDYFPLAKDKIGENGYGLTDIAKHKKTYHATMKSEDLPDDMRDGDDSVLNEIIECVNTSEHTCAGVGVFRLIPKELAFYQEHSIPLPRFCPNCRQLARIKQRNPLKLWLRGCNCRGPSSENEVYQNTIEHFHKSTRCPNEFETTYPPRLAVFGEAGALEREEIVYCEQCYVAEAA
ncbi:MAG: hypothetical protein HY001_01890 [Candidatus Portnoybacteria bacterium]|nr:hypothetical protein [Candidatus Portnoybacteria bacterium]